MRPLLIILVCLLALTGCSTSEEREGVQPKQTTCTRSVGAKHCTTY